MRPDFSMYPVTTWDPGANEVLTDGLTVRPFSTARLATSPAPTITYGLDVLVHEVMAAMATDAGPNSAFWPSMSSSTVS